jgi:hypothetical protein
MFGEIYIENYKTNVDSSRIANSNTMKSKLSQRSFSSSIKNEPIYDFNLNPKSRNSKNL